MGPGPQAPHGHSSFWSPGCGRASLLLQPPSGQDASSLMAAGLWVLDSCLCSPGQGRPLAPLGPLTQKPPLRIWSQFCHFLPTEAAAISTNWFFCFRKRQVSRKRWTPGATRHSADEPWMPSSVPLGSRLLGVAPRGRPACRRLFLSFLQDTPVTRVGIALHDGRRSLPLDSPLWAERFCAHMSVPRTPKAHLYTQSFMEGPQGRPWSLAARRPGSYSSHSG